MNWVNLAVLSTAIMGVTNIFDSHLISKRVPSVRLFLLLMNSVVLLIGLIFFILFPPGPGVSLTVWLVGIGQGGCRISGVILMLYAYRQQEVSRVVPATYAYPIFVAMMAVPLLGESLEYLDWLAILIVVAGAIMISLRRGQSGTAHLGKSFLYVAGAALFFAFADVGSKYVLFSLSSPQLFWLTSLTASVIGLSISVRPGIFKELSELKQRNSTIGLFIFNQTYGVIGVVMGMYALQQGPVSLVSTITASRPLFVLLYALILSRISPMFLDFGAGKGLLTLRIVATIMVIGGVAIIYLL